MVRGAIAVIIMAACASCEAGPSESANDASPPVQSPVDPAGDASREIEPGGPGIQADDRNADDERPIDPKGAEGAIALLQDYAALIEQGRFARARRLWSDSGRASGMSEQAFAQSLGGYVEIRADVGAPGRMEGAAGSIFVEIPIRFHGKRAGGSSFSSVGTATLRRVNDVPGSTPEQRQWRIYRLELQPPL